MQESVLDALMWHRVKNSDYIREITAKAEGCFQKIIV